MAHSATSCQRYNGNDPAGPPRELKVTSMERLSGDKVGGDERVPLEHRLLSQGRWLLEGRFADYCLRVLMAFFSAWTTA